MPALVALVALVISVALGIWLFTADHLVLGFALVLAGIPIALAAFVATGNRRA